MKILITGSSGFVGKHLISKLSAYNEVIGYDLQNGEDVLDERLLLKKLKGVEMVIHLAAFISVQESWEKPEEYIRNNGLGTLSVVKNSIKAGVGRFIFFSSAAVNVKPITPYAVSKMCAENILKLYEKDLSIVVIRPENIYGIGQKASYGYVIHNFINAIKRNKAINIFGDGNQTRDFVYIDDVISTVVQVIDQRLTGGVLSLGTGKSTSINELAQIIGNILDKRVSKVYLPFRDEPRTSKADLDTLKKVGIECENFSTLDIGIKKLLELA